MSPKRLKHKRKRVYPNFKQPVELSYDSELLGSLSQQQSLGSSSKQQPLVSSSQQQSTDSASEQQPLDSASEQQPLFSSSSTSEQPPKCRKKREGPHRGPSRALKYKKLRLVQPKKLKLELPEHLGAAVGERAMQFVGECADWVKEICPLNVQKWKDIPDEILDRLYDKIRGKWDLPTGDYVQKALKDQCSSLYRHWRERLKSRYFTGKSLKEAERACPPSVNPSQWRWLVYTYWSSPKQREKSEKNRENALSNKMYSACGAKSTARIIYEMEVEEAEKASETEAVIEPNIESEEPAYIKLWNRTKRHKGDGKLDEKAESKLEEFQSLHKKEIEEKGVDNLSIDEAYKEVLGYRSGYARGLGKGHPVLSEGRKNKQAKMQAEIERLQTRENEMRVELERLQAEAQRKEEEAIEREAKRDQEAKEREARLRADLEAQMKAKFMEWVRQFGPQMV